MNREKAIQEIKSNLKKLFNFAKEEFNTLKLEDGTQVTISTTDLEVGSELYIIDDSGNRTTLDDGTYTLQDGRTFVIADNLVTEIEAVEEADDLETGGDETTGVETSKQKMDGLPAGHAEGQSEEEQPEAEPEQSDMAKRVDDLEHQIAEILNILNKMGDSQNDLNEQMMSRIKEIGEEPGDKPVIHKKKGYESYSKNSAKEAKSQELFERLLKSTGDLRKRSNNNFI